MAVLNFLALKERVVTWAWALSVEIFRLPVLYKDNNEEAGDLRSGRVGLFQTFS